MKNVLSFKNDKKKYDPLLSVLKDNKEYIIYTEKKDSGPKYAYAAVKDDMHLTPVEEEDLYFLERILDNLEKDKK